MDDAEYVLDVLDTSYDTIERSADLDEQIAARDPGQPDALEYWQNLRALPAAGAASTAAPPGYVQARAVE